MFRPLCVLFFVVNKDDPLLQSFRRLTVFFSSFLLLLVSFSVANRHDLPDRTLGGSSSRDHLPPFSSSECSKGSSSGVSVSSGVYIYRTALSPMTLLVFTAVLPPWLASTEYLFIPLTILRYYPHLLPFTYALVSACLVKPEAVSASISLLEYPRWGLQCAKTPLLDETKVTRS